ncbi:hypothetical protein F5Y01DRAFT_325866 [Xylaria sp. FL0043]|nr:hypothetical protein F5Y01DRAFT_325866 [Xylaria sp. FL0043]
MQSDELQQPEEPAPPGSKTRSLTRFIKSNFTINKSKATPALPPTTEAAPASPPATGAAPSSATATPERDVGTNRRAYFRPRRHHNPTAEDLKNNVGALQIAMDGAWARRHHSRYRDARALLVCWPDPDPTTQASMVTDPHLSMQSDGSLAPLSSSPESNQASISSDVMTRFSSSTASRVLVKQGPFVAAAYQLEGVLKRRYGIRAQVWKIPSLENPPEHLLKEKIRHFVDEFGGPDNLLIFWYGGHAKFVNAALNPFGDGNDGQVIWYGLNDEPRISVKAITKVLGLARGDVLMLNDNPFAQHTYVSNINGPGLFELLGSGATDNDPATAASFTRTVAKMLDSSHVSDHGISVTELHRKLLDLTAVPVARASVPVSPISVTQTVKIPAYPVYVQLAQLAHSAGRNIVLSRLDASLAAETNYMRNVSEPGVNVYFRLARPCLDVQRWKEWILNAPAEAEEVSVKVGGKTR